MSHSRKATAGLAMVVLMACASPVFADPATEAFIATTQHAIETLNSMQALFVRMDQRKAAQAAGAATTSPAPAPTPEKPEQNQK
jgi:type II secretory pathway component PulM